MTRDGRSLTDEELRRQLDRRVSVAPLTPDDRTNLIRAARLRLSEPVRPSFGPRALGWVAGIATVIVLALIGIPLLLGSLGPHPTPSSSPSGPAASATTTPAPTATPAPTPAASPTPVPTATPLRPLTIEFGDAVVATGRVMAFESETQPVLCFDVVSAGRSPGCGMTIEWVKVFDIDARSLPGSESEGGTFVSDLVNLHGVWQSDGIHVTTFDVVEQETVPLAPCDPPAGGWPGTGTEEERYLNERALGDYLSQHRGTFDSWWIARSWTGPPDAAHRVLVVGTTQDPDSVIDDLLAIFPSNLCVEHVDFSQNELYEVIRAMLEPDPPWNRTMDARRNRVIIQPLMVDQDVIDLLAPYQDRVIVEPAVRLEEPPG